MASVTASAGTVMRPLFAPLVATALVVATLCSTAATATAEEHEIAIGLDADFSGPARLGAIALQQGAEIAISQINAAGGVLGQQLKLVVTDHRGQSAARPCKLSSIRRARRGCGYANRCPLPGRHRPIATGAPVACPGHIALGRRHTIHLQRAFSQLRLPRFNPRRARGRLSRWRGSAARLSANCDHA